MIRSEIGGEQAGRASDRECDSQVGFADRGEELGRRMAEWAQGCTTCSRRAVPAWSCKVLVIPKGMPRILFRIGSELQDARCQGNMVLSSTWPGLLRMSGCVWVRLGVTGHECWALGRHGRDPSSISKATSPQPTTAP